MDKTTAKNEDHYRYAWSMHIKELASLALAANIDYDKYLLVKRHLEEWIDLAATRQFKDK